MIKISILYDFISAPPLDLPQVDLTGKASDYVQNNKQFRVVSGNSEVLSQHEEQGTHQERGPTLSRSRWKVILSTTEEMGNPFIYRTRGLFVLDTCDIMASTVEQQYILGNEQYQQYVTKRLQERTTPLFDKLQKRLQVASIQPSSCY